MEFDECYGKPRGATIPMMMKATEWQKHSVRSFLAAVVRKRLKLQLTSEKIDGNRVYKISGAASSAKSRHLALRPGRAERSWHASRSVRRRRTVRHSTSRLRACVISTSQRFEPVGKRYSDRSRPHICLAICCTASCP